ncbi:MAG TPA: CvpA family protein [Candidatus Cloacimonadota bacterium]|nr:CvpA family protein [Candidatus Cloacimonadota bacterium]
MNILDIIIAVFLVIFMINGLRKGFIKNVLGLLGLIVIIILIIKIGNPVKIMLIQKIGISEILALILAYVLIIIFITLVVKLISFILSQIITTLNAGCLDKMLGMVFGLLNGVLIIALILIVFDISPAKKTVRIMTQDSVAVQYIRKFTLVVDKNFPEVKQIKIPVEEAIKNINQKVNETIEDKS